MKALSIIVNDSKYLLNIDYVDRIIQKVKSTNIPESKDYIEGVIDFNNDALKVISMRRLLGYKSIDDENFEMIKRIEKTHIDWIEALRETILEKVPFEYTANPHNCELGKKIDELISCISCGSKFRNSITNGIKVYHDEFHQSAIHILEEKDKKKAIEYIDTSLKDLMNNIFKELAYLKENISKLTLSNQRTIILKQEDRLFGLTVDKIENIVEFDEKDFTYIKNNHESKDGINIEQSIIINNEILLYINFDSSLLD